MQVGPVGLLLPLATERTAVPAYPAIVDDVANNRQIDLPSGGWVAGTLSTAVAQGLSAAQQAQAQGNIGLTTDNLFQASGSASDFSTNGAFYVLASSNFTAVGTKFDATGVLALNHQASSTAQFSLYLALVDLTANSTVSTGQTNNMQLNSSILALGTLTAIYGVTGLTPGHVYQQQIVGQRVQAVGPTAWSAAVVGRNY